MRAARGELIVDARRRWKNDPADIPKLIRAFRAEAANPAIGMIAGERIGRRTHGAARASRFGNRVRRAMLGDNATIPDAASAVPARRVPALPYFDHFTLSDRSRDAAKATRFGSCRESPLRGQGLSKYGVWTGLLSACRDLMGVMWLFGAFAACRDQGVVDVELEPGADVLRDPMNVLGAFAQGLSHRASSSNGSPARWRRASSRWRSGFGSLAARGAAVLWRLTGIADFHRRPAAGIIRYSRNLYSSTATSARRNDGSPAAEGVSAAIPRRSSCASCRHR